MPLEPDHRIHPTHIVDSNYTEMYFGDRLHSITDERNDDYIVEFRDRLGVSVFNRRTEMVEKLTQDIASNFIIVGRIEDTV